MSTISNVFCQDVTIFNYLKIYCQKDFAGHVEYKYITSRRDIKRLLLKKAQCCRQYCHCNAQRTNDNIWLKNSAELNSMYWYGYHKILKICTMFQKSMY